MQIPVTIIKPVRARPKCGRPTRSGTPCGASTRYSKPLNRFAPACRAHMTDAEHEEFEANPLWTLDGQILWYLAEQSDRDHLAYGSEVAAQLDSQTSVVLAALRALEKRGVVASLTEKGRSVWGTTGHVGRLENGMQDDQIKQLAEVQQIVDRNDVLEDTRYQLEKAVAGQAIEVSSLAGMFPASRGEPHPEHILISTGDPVAASWLLGRLRTPSHEEWMAHRARLNDLLRCLDRAGWFAGPDDYFTENDPESGPILCVQLRRTCMAFDVEYMPSSRSIRLQPYDDLSDDFMESFSMLDNETAIELSGDLEQQKRTVTERAADLGLLDATRVAFSDNRQTELSDFMAGQHREWIFSAAADERGITINQLLAEIQADKDLVLFFDCVIGTFGANVLPDCIPDAVALGIAAWCWRNDTAVEMWHLDDDILMARTNMAVTTAIRPLIDPVAGIDWEGIEEALTSAAWALPDGRLIAELFGEGWREVRDTVMRRLDAWKHRDERVLGTQATMRIFTIAGSTSYTRNWSGQGRWHAICRAVINDAAQVGIDLPGPYDELGADALLADAGEPSRLPDKVLNWLIDMPAADLSGPRGTRMHDATLPLIRVIAPLNHEPS
jgi:hypothetical protein